jgi:hypothetical protein
VRAQLIGRLRFKSNAKMTTPAEDECWLEVRCNELWCDWAFVGMSNLEAVREAPSRFGAARRANTVIPVQMN